MDESPPSRLVGRDVATVLTVLLAAVVTALGAVASARGWIPTGDDAFLSLRTRHTISTHPILLNNASSAGPSAGSQYNHPGAFPLTLLTPVTLIGGPGALALATALANAAWMVAISLMVRRVAGSGAQVGALVVTAALAASMGPSFLVDPWNPTYGMWPIAALVVAGWGVRAGQTALLAVAVVAASVAFQTHLSLTVMSGAVALWALLGVLTRWYRADADGRRRHSGALAVAAGVGAVANAQMLADQLFGSGNLGKILGGTGFREATVSLRQATAVLVSKSVLPPWWFRGSWAAPVFLDELPSGATTIVALTLMLGATAVALGLARRRMPLVTSLFGVLAVAAVPATFVATRFPLRIGIPLPYFRWVWPLAAIWTAALAAALATAVRRPVSPSSISPSSISTDVPRRRLVALRPTFSAEHSWRGVSVWRGVSAAAVVALLGAMWWPSAPELSPNPDWAQDIARPFAAAALGTVPEGEPVVVDQSIQEAALWVIPALIDQLDAAGVDVRVEDAVLVQQTAERYRATGTERWHLTVRGGLQIDDAPPGGRRLARHDDLTTAEARELDRLIDELTPALERSGAVTLTTIGRGETDADDLRHLTTATLPPAELLRSVPFRLALERGAVAVDGIDDDALDRATTLGARDGGRSIALYLTDRSAPIG